jgi:aryl-alcohol dehydrogenase-like predicted oxidoreductase
MTTNSTTLRLADTEVPRIGLGTNRLTDEPEHVAFIREAVGAGIRHIDTAHLYAGGESEAVIGAASPDGAVIATKGGYHTGEGAPRVLSAQIRESLRRLRTDTIELYYLHRVDTETPLEVSLATIAEHRDRGVIRHVGLSEVSIEQIERAREIVPITAVQNHFNLSERKREEVVDHCTREGIVFVPFYPLKGGAGPAGAEIAARHQASERQIALAWLLKRSPLMLPIPGTLSLDHLEENLAALEIELTDDEFEVLGRAGG